MNKITSRVESFSGAIFAVCIVATLCVMLVKLYRTGGSLFAVFPIAEVTITTETGTNTYVMPVSLPKGPEDNLMLVVSVGAILSALTLVFLDLKKGCEYAIQKLRQRAPSKNQYR